MFVLTLSHDHTAHEYFDRPDALERNLALARSLVEPKLVSQLFLADGVGMIDLVSENKERHLAKVFHGQQCIKLGFGFLESFVVLCIHKENDSADFWEVVLPEATSLLVTAQIKGCEPNIAYR